MPTAYKTPGVYLVEKDAFPGSVVEVATAVPAFIGYTEKTEYNKNSLIYKPVRITSFAEYLNIFGGAPSVRYTYKKGNSTDAKAVLSAKPAFRLYDSVRIFFQNGGTTCYICSVGGYDKGIDQKMLSGGITPFEKEQEPTLMIIPDAVSLDRVDICANVHKDLLAHCKKMQNRFTILDVFDGFKERNSFNDCVKDFRDNVGTDYLNYGASYYPWVKTNVVSSNEVSFAIIEPEKDDNGQVTGTPYKQLADDLQRTVLPDLPECVKYPNFTVLTEDDCKDLFEAASVITGLPKKEDIFPIELGKDYTQTIEMLKNVTVPDDNPNKDKIKEELNKLLNCLQSVHGSFLTEDAYADLFEASPAITGLPEKTDIFPIELGKDYTQTIEMLKKVTVPDDHSNKKMIDEELNKLLNSLQNIQNKFLTGDNFKDLFDNASPIAGIPKKEDIFPIELGKDYADALTKLNAVTVPKDNPKKNEIETELTNLCYCLQNIQDYINKNKDIINIFQRLRKFNVAKGDSTDMHNQLMAVCPAYVEMVSQMLDELNLMAPSAAMAGVYARVDNNEGVWKAPANVSINGVVSPAVNMTNEEQEDLNVPLNGKAVNAIRYFIGDGVKVWGARTLDGNSLDWRYINVRRTIIMLEESIKQACKAYVFENNTATTWLTMKNMIDNFLNGIWRRGGLAGQTPEDAYEVHVGLGDTMTAEDILEGYLRITVKVALIRPAEFIELTFQQLQQKS